MYIIIIIYNLNVSEIKNYVLCKLVLFVWWLDINMKIMFLIIRVMFSIMLIMME